MPTPTKETGTELKMYFKSHIHVNFQQQLPSFSGQIIQLNVAIFDKPLAVLAQCQRNRKRNELEQEPS